jgi:hypothetical protein
LVLIPIETTSPRAITRAIATISEVGSRADAVAPAPSETTITAIANAISRRASTSGKANSSDRQRMSLPYTGAVASV